MFDTHGGAVCLANYVWASYVPLSGTASKLDRPNSFIGTYL